MDLPFENWYKVIETRRSRRTFIAKVIEPNVMNLLNGVINELNQLHKGVRLKLVEQSPLEILSGVVGPYGKITGATAYIAVVIDQFEDSLIERGGYMGQAIALEATVHGLSTCWVGGTFNDGIAQHEEVKGHEKIISILPIGYARKNYSLTEKMMNKMGDYHKRKPIEEIVEGLSVDEWPQWISAAIHSARLAPSAYNRQPIRYAIGKDHTISLTIDKPEEETKVPKVIDRGIAMLHIDLAIKHHNIRGKWQYSQNSNVVSFKELS